MQLSQLVKVLRPGGNYTLECYKQFSLGSTIILLGRPNKIMSRLGAFIDYGIWNRTDCRAVRAQW